LANRAGRGKRIGWCCAAALAWGVAAAAAMTPEEVEADWGFLYSRHRLLGGDVHTRALGPLLERAASPDGNRFQAVRPLYSRLWDAEAERTGIEIVWPLAMRREFREQLLGRYLLLCTHIDADIHDPASPYRFWILPVYVQGRDATGDPYRAVFPVGGTARDFLFQDEIQFAVFPLWMRTRLNEVRMQHWLWPIYKRGGGDGIEQFRVAPFYGYARQRDNYRKRFVLWPFWTSAEYTYPASQGRGYILFPLWGHLDLSTEQTWWVLPPFFRHTRGETRNVMHLPYPFIQYAAGDIDKLYLWPLWGRKHVAGTQSSFLLWPIFWRQHIDKGESVFHRTLALPFVHAHRETSRPAPDATEGDLLERYLKVWPLFSYQREGEETRWRCLELWPLQNTGPIERNYAPFWRLYERRTRGSAMQSELLWGLVRHHRDGDRERYLSAFPLFQYHRDGAGGENRAFSIFKGLIGYERRDGSSRWRLLYGLHFGEGEARP
jgi:hypothetical protein